MAPSRLPLISSDSPPSRLRHPPSRPRPPTTSPISSATSRNLLVYDAADTPLIFKSSEPPATLVLINGFPDLGSVEWKTRGHERVLTAVALLD
ncbi:hypothetical protein Syun_006684 [Stephania yunnanensis]|uniref:Uncharacterized protein n=1 Tax=Stephania yunnanensis TaxID=152371 RepID=A0AAP0PXV2_9MAGN